MTNPTSYWACLLQDTLDGLVESFESVHHGLQVMGNLYFTGYLCHIVGGCCFYHMHIKGGASMWSTVHHKIENEARLTGIEYGCSCYTIP